MQRALLVANPAASQFTGGLHRTVSRMLARHHELETAWPHDPEDSRRVVAEAVRAGVSLVVAMGGDGVVHHVAQPLIGTDAVLGIIPAGTTNVLARVLGVPTRPTVAAKLLSRAEPRRVPTVAVRHDGEGGEGERHALFSLGVGVDAEVVERADAEPYRKYRFGSIHYASTAISTVWTDIRRRRSEILVGGCGPDLEAIGVMVQVHPVFTYFGRIRLTLDDRPPDPMSALVIQRLPIRRTAKVVWAARRGTLGSVADLELLRGCHRLEVRSLDRPQSIQLDGEVIHGVERMTATAAPESLLVALP